MHPIQNDIISRRDFWAESTIDQKRALWDDGKPHECNNNVML